MSVSPTRVWSHQKKNTLYILEKYSRFIFRVGALGLFAFHPRFSAESTDHTYPPQPMLSRFVGGGLNYFYRTHAKDLISPSSPFFFFFFFFFTFSFPSSTASPLPSTALIFYDKLHFIFSFTFNLPETWLSAIIACIIVRHPLPSTAAVTPTMAPAWASLLEAGPAALRPLTPARGRTAPPTMLGWRPTTHP